MSAAVAALLSARGARSRHGEGVRRRHRRIEAPASPPVPGGDGGRQPTRRGPSPLWKSAWRSFGPRRRRPPCASWRLSVGWPIKMPAKGEAESISEFVSSRSSFQLGGLQEMGLVDDEHDAAVPLGRLGGQQVGRLQP